MKYNKRQTSNDKRRRPGSKRQTGAPAAPKDRTQGIPLLWSMEARDLLAESTLDEKGYLAALLTSPSKPDNLVDKTTNDVNDKNILNNGNTSTPDTHTSTLFSPHAWNPHALLSSASLPEAPIGPPPVPVQQVSPIPSIAHALTDDDMFLSSLFDDVLNDSEQFIAGMSVPDPNVSFHVPLNSDKTLEPFDMDNVSYVGSPDVREIVRRYPSKNKQELDAKGIVDMTTNTMARVRIVEHRCCHLSERGVKFVNSAHTLFHTTPITSLQASITSRDIQVAKQEMARMLRSFAPNAETETHHTTTSAQLAQPRTTRRNPDTTMDNTIRIATNSNTTATTHTATTAYNIKSIKTPRASPGLPLFPHLPKPPTSNTTVTTDTTDTIASLQSLQSLESLSTLDTFTHQHEDWLETMLLTTSPATANLSSFGDVKLLLPVPSPDLSLVGLPPLPHDLLM